MLDDADFHSSSVRKEPNGSTAQSGQAPAAMRKPVEGTIGFIGLGHMGSAMAANLAAGGRKVTGYVRESGRAQALKALGVEPTNDLARLFDCDVVISMVPDDAAAHEIVFGREQPQLKGLASGLTAGATHLSMSTISPAMSSMLAAEHARCGQGYVAAPVLGNPDAAKARELFIIAAGAAAQIDRCRPIFELLGQRSFVLGSDPASANLVKLVSNVMVATSLEAMGEVFALARKHGLDPETLLDILTSTMFGSRVHKIYGAKMVAPSFSPSGFAFPLALKDVRLALAEADAASVPMPSVSAVRDRLITGIARGYGQLDWSALGELAAEEAGLETERPNGGA
jgi:3-hydroxyisobutyrate dehydrogenase-like beta-hydroxyacid dehydrogenase